MALPYKFFLLIIYSIPVLCSMQRPKRQTTLNSIQYHPHSQQPLNLEAIYRRYPELEILMPQLCKQHNRVPWFRRRQEQVFAVNEQLIPQPFPYSFDNHHHHGHHDTFSDGRFPGDQNDHTISTQVEGPPVGYQGLNDPYYPQNSWYNHRPNYQQIVDADPKVNIRINAQNQNRQPINLNADFGSRSQLIRPYNQNTLPMQPSYAPYGNIQDTRYGGGSTLYPRSISYLDQSDFPLDMLYSTADTDPVLGERYFSTIDRTTPYTVDPRVLSIFDEYIQSKIDANKAKVHSDKSTGLTNNQSKN